MKVLPPLARGQQPAQGQVQAVQVQVRVLVQAPMLLLLVLLAYVLAQVLAQVLLAQVLELELELELALVQALVLVVADAGVAEVASAGGHASLWFVCMVTVPTVYRGSLLNYGSTFTQTQTLSRE